MLFLHLVGCVINADGYPRPRDLEAAWLISKPRLLGVRSTPAEPRPGDVIALEALLVDPEDAIANVLWTVCPADGSGSGFGCIAEEPEVIGFQPLLEPSYTVPVGLLDDLDEAGRREGRYVLVQVTGLPPGLEPDTDLADVDFNSIESGYKRVVVSEASTPNQNPDIDTFTVAGTTWAPDTVLEVDPGEVVEVGILLTDESVQAYEYLNSAGVVEARVEEPYAAWFATGGTVDEPATLYPFLESTWTAPAESGPVTIHTVVRDRRGGQDWAALEVVVR